MTSVNFRISGSHPSTPVHRYKNCGLRKSLVAAIFIFYFATAFTHYPDNTWVDKTLKTLSLREKIAQLVQIRVSGKFINRQSPDFEETRTQIRQNHVGGVILFAGNIYESAVLLNELQTVSKLPLLVSSDFERGASFRIADTTSFPYAMAIGATGNDQYAYQQGYITGQEARALGVHWIYAPVMDVNNNPDNPVINIRSFGEDPKLVARMGSAFIRGAKKAGVLTTAKHFPGHGDTTTDSHIRLPVVDSNMDRLRAIELEPFRSAIEAGVDSIMTAHVAVPEVTREPKIPATLSSKILTDLLRNTLKFRGLVVTDALEMAGITNHYWCGIAAVRAIQAGADVLLLPPNATVAINEVERAVQQRLISEARIELSARKILEVKYRMGLWQNRHVPISRIGKVVASPDNIRLAQEITDHSITAVKDKQQLLPVNPLSNTRIFSLVLTSDYESSPGAIFQADMRKRFPSIVTRWANARVSKDQLASIERAIKQSDLIVCSTWAPLTTGRGAESIPKIHRTIYSKLSGSHKPLIWVAFGNPYILREIPKTGTYICTFSDSDVSQIATAKALSGAINISGKMPVSIPGFSKVGDGLFIPRIEMGLKTASAEAAKVSQNAFKDTGQLLASIVNSGVIPGAELLIGSEGTIVFELNIGKNGYSTDSTKVTSNTVYDLESLSRLVGDSSAAMLATEARCLISEDPITTYLPELHDTDYANYSVQDLLKSFSNEDGGKSIGIYNNATLLEKVVSRTTGDSIELYLSKQLFKPMGMNNTFFNPPENFSGGIAQKTSSKPLLYSNAQDLAAFAQMLVNRGVYQHHRYFGYRTLRKYTDSQSPWSKISKSGWTDKLFSSSAFGHNSPGGSFLWIDPAKQLFVVFLTNARQEGKRVEEVQREIGESIASAIKDLRSSKAQ